MTNCFQQPLRLACGGEWLVAIVSRPRQPRPRGVLILVGGPQYRVGSHRQFALLARHLAESGTAAIRFDYRGMGDSSGDARGFEEVERDVRVAADAFFGAVPELHDIVIWGLCDAASAALFYAHRDPRISGVVLLNPWVRTAGSEAKAYLRHYYLERVLSVNLWRRVMRGEVDLMRSLRSLMANCLRAIRPAASAHPGDSTTIEQSSQRGSNSLPERMADALARFNGRVLLILSGNDLTAREFIDVSQASKQWRELLASPRVKRYELLDANHTFSRREWRDQVAAWTAVWVQSW